MNTPVYGVSKTKYWTASELLGDEPKQLEGSDKAMRDALKHAGEMKRKGLI